MFNAAYCYMNGDGVEQNRQEALYWFIQAAKAGNARAIYFIADFLMGGYDVVDTDPITAIKFYGTSARLDHPASLHNLGALLYNGKDVSKDKTMGYQLIKKAAELGYEPAISSLSQIAPQKNN